MNRMSPLQHSQDEGDRCTPQSQQQSDGTLQQPSLLAVSQMPNQLSTHYSIGPIISIPGAPAQDDPINASSAHIDINDSAQIVAEVADLSMGRKRESCEC